MGEIKGRRWGGVRPDPDDPERGGPNCGIFFILNPFIDLDTKRSHGGYIPLASA
jgi:hypothetical protein